ncbi:hypothetical protein IL306_004555 [Fusarium sp. DS 682]|nr:hypothetical protein IL306_004555 [Fusarium sp. DS 682]
MIEHFQSIGRDSVSRGSSVHICFSSRHYPFIDIEDGQELILERHPGHEHDLEAYIHSKLKLKKNRKAEADELRNDIRVKANGVFLWVKLVVQMLNEEFGNGTSHAIRKKRLQEIPPELSELLRDILRRDNKRPENLLLSIEWILFSKRPLEWEELYFALISGLHPDTLTEWDRHDTTVQDMKQFILSSSKGLAEITKPKAKTVQFIHESVRDFLLKEDGLGDLRRDLQLEKEDFRCSAHDRLKTCCHTYIQLDISQSVPSDTPLSNATFPNATYLQKSVLDKFPFMEYASRHLLYHAESAGSKLPQDNFIKSFSIKPWIALDNLFEGYYRGPRQTSNASLIYILARDGLTNLMRSAFRLGFRTNIHRERLENPLFAALANEHRDAVKALLQQETSVSQANNISAQLGYGKYFSVSKGHTPLHWAIQRGDIPLATILLASKEIIPVVAAREERTPLSLAAENGHESIVRLLLATETVQLDSKEYMGRTPLALAAIEGYESIVRLLLSTGNVDVNSKDYSGCTPLLSLVIRLVLAQKSSNKARNIHDRTAFLDVSSCGYKADTWLPAIVGNTNTQDCMSLTTSQEDVVILQSPERSLISTTSGYARKVAIVKLLLENGADINAKDNYRCTPLSYAIDNGSTDIIQMLKA